MLLVTKSWALGLSLAVLSFPGLLKGFAQTPQTTLGSVAGVVLDQEGKPIPDADVYAVPEQDMRTLLASTTTDPAGKFILHDLPAVVVYVYAYKESDGYPKTFARFFALPNDRSLVSVKVEAGQVTTGVTMKRAAKAARLKINVTDEN